MGSCISTKKKDFGYIKLETLSGCFCKNYDKCTECNVPEELYGVLNGYLYLFNNVINNYAKNEEYLKFFDVIQNLERICSHSRYCEIDVEIYKYGIELREKWYSTNNKIIQRMFLKIDIECKTINSVKERMLEEYKKKLEFEKKLEIKKFCSSPEFKEQVESLSLLLGTNTPKVPKHIPRDDDNNNNNNNGEALLLEF